jgi:hypothetical protein
MKRTILMLAAVLCLAASCEKKYITEEYITEYHSNVTTFDIRIAPTDWLREQGAQEPGSTNYLYYIYSSPEFSKDVMKNGAVVAYIYTLYDVKTQQGAWNLLPYVYPLEMNDNGTLTIIPETIRCEWEEGKITFVIQDLDGYAPLNVNETLLMRVSVIL